jgi:predicted ribosome quality control (RQC) complex YloA/Tae2 family protein
MKDGLASFDLLALTAELQPLVGGYLDKVYQRADEIVLKVNVSGQGRREVYAKVGKWICLREVPDKPETPPPFAATLRQHLDNARIAAIEQRGFDRILILRFDRGSQLVFELFGKGNVVLVRDGTTVAAFARAKFRDRTVGPGFPYDFPPPAADPFAMTFESFAAALVAAKGSLVKALASGMNLGGPYAEEVCLRAGVEKNAKASGPEDERLPRVHAALLDLHRQVRDARDPRVVLETGSPVDVTPVPLQQHAGRDQETFPTFSGALVSYLERAVPTAPTDDGPAARLRRRLEQQEESLQAAHEEAVRSEALAQLLYAHYAPFDELLTRARAGTLEPGGTVLAVDKDARVVRIAVGDAAELELDWMKDLRGNSQVFYDRKKEALVKAGKIEEAIVETRRQLEGAEKEAAKIVARPRTKATKAF